MNEHQNEEQKIETTHNTARFFVENRQIAWVLLLATIVWGVIGYRAMPQRKDPDVPPREAVAICNWPGASAEQVEQLVTRKMEAKIAENSKVETVTSNTRTGVTVVVIKLHENVGVGDRAKEFDDLKLKLDGIRDLPDGAGPIQFVKDFGETATLLLTVASPPVDEVELGLRAKTIRSAIEESRGGIPAPGRIAITFCFPTDLAVSLLRGEADRFARFSESSGLVHDAKIFSGPGYLGIDVATSLDEASMAAAAQRYVVEQLHQSEFHPDVWGPAIIGNPANTEQALREIAGDKYSHRQLDDFVELIVRTLRSVPVVSKVTTAGTLDERIYLEYSQERLASYGISEASLPDLLSARNVSPRGGVLEVGDHNMRVEAAGEFADESEIGQVMVPIRGGGQIYLRDVVDVARSYESPARFLNFYSRPTGHDTANGETEWTRTRAVTLSIQMKAGEKITEFDRAVDSKLEELEAQLPDDLVLARTSDQPQQVEENVHLFMSSLYEAVILVVLVSLIGFWEWRSALLMALSIPLTLAMTFGMVQLFGVDLQQVSIASLIIALGLLVDDPVVAGDAIKRDLAHGHKRIVAAWFGPTKLAKAILYATLTNIAAYLPFLLLTGEVGRFIVSLPIVIGCSLIASRLVSMTFIPLLGYYILRPKSEPTVEERRNRGFFALYYRAGAWAINHRWAALGLAMVFLFGGGLLAKQIKSEFFSKDLQYLATVDVWLPEDANLIATRTIAEQTESIIRRAADEYGIEHPDKKGKPRQVLASISTFLGGGAPRFWSSVSPEQEQTNYAQIILQSRDKHDTSHILSHIQEAVDREIAGATVDVRQLETGAAVGIPIAIRVSGESEQELRRLAAELKGILRATGGVARVRDDWGAESFALQVGVDADRANLTGVTNHDVVSASMTALSGARVGSLRDGDKRIPIVARLKMRERATAGDLSSLYVTAGRGAHSVPLSQIATVDYSMQTERIQRRQQFRTITVSAFARPGTLPSEALMKAMPRIKEHEAGLPPGFDLEIGGEYHEQMKSFKNLSMVMLMSILAIFLTLVIQFKHAWKPLVVFAAIPFGVIGALIGLRVTGTPFGFMAFLGVASLIGVIVSHIIVLFDFIEEAREHGASLQDALLDAGIVRLRPVMITVGATVIALFPLAAHGGPMWQPMCYTQIGGLVTATFVTLLLVPVLYTIFVKDLRLIRWER